MSGLEKDIEQVVVNWALKHGFLAPKVKFSEAGWPDRLFISPIGHTIFIEFKRPGYKPDPLQEFRLDQLRKRGIPAAWTDNTVEGINILKAAVEPARLPDPSDSVATFPSRSGSVLGPGSGEDVNLSGSTENTVPKIFNSEMSDRSTFKTNVLRLAGGNPEVGRVQGDDLRDSPRGSEGSNACE